FVRIGSGSFIMGSAEGSLDSWGDERPLRRVTLDAFYLSRYPVTQEQWRSVMGSGLDRQIRLANRQRGVPLFNAQNQGGSLHARGEGDRHPIYFVSWFEAIEFANKMSELAGLEPAYEIGGTEFRPEVRWNRAADGYRLPTEAEWEYAAKGGDGSPGDFAFSGSDDPDEVAWYWLNADYVAHEVGKLAPNALGLYDMSGNVEEWVWDWRAAYPDMEEINPEGPGSGRMRVARGGSWYDPNPNFRRDQGLPFRPSSSGWVRSASRASYIPNVRFTTVGFRLARSIFEED
ncbi:MAG: formylglycine-generating enzyme family protein, partial [Treponema sp.]|nr:formylglycine-generating enzyme family protein [Treponema sp.]